MSSSYAVRSTPSETFNKLTVSCWFKGHADGTQRNFWGLYDNSSSDRFFALYFSTNGSLYGYWKQNEGTFFTLGTTQKFRDPNAWTHFVMTMDTTLSTAADRVKFYVNGERVTSFEDGLDTITQSQTCNLMNGTTDGRMQWGGGKVSGTQYYFPGGMSHCHMCVGYAYDASSFGSTDSATGIWKINTNPSVSYGTNGGFWFKDGSQLTDSSTNSNTLTSSGTLTNTEDCPSNNFCTWNAVKKLTLTLSNGNTTTLANGDNGVWGTIGDNQGKYYWETQQNANSTMMGIASEDVTQSTDRSSNAGVYGVQNGTTYSYYRNNGSSGQSSGFPQVTNSNVLCHALDLDNGKYYLGIDGVFKDLSGTTSDISAGSNATFTGLDTTKFWFPFTESRGSSAGCDANFGNGFFGTTQISSEGTNASGIGKFEYDVPAGYTALSTKGLNE